MNQVVEKFSLENLVVLLGATFLMVSQISNGVIPYCSTGNPGAIATTTEIGKVRIIILSYISILFLECF